MKLIFCEECHDVVSIFQGEERKCLCGKSSGIYLDPVNATYSGSAIPMGFANKSLMAALLNQPQNGLGHTFTAFVIPKDCPTFKLKEA